MEATALALDAGTLSTHGTALLQAGGGEFARESYLADHLPYFALADDDVMVLREGDLMATLRLDGLNPMTSEDARLDALKRAVAAIVAQTGNAFGFYIHRISVPQDLGMRPIEGDSFAAAIDARWQAHVKDLRPAKRQLYLSVIRRPDISARIPFLRTLARKAWVKDRATRLQELNEVMGFFEVALSSANPVRLTRTGGEWLGYLNTLNAGSFSP